MYPKNSKYDFLEYRTIYALVDPRTEKNNIYIGMTTNIRNRYSQHKQHTSNDEKSDWLSEIESEGLFPYLLILEEEEMYAFEAAQLESVWIRVIVTQQNIYHLVNYKYDKQRAWFTFESLKRKASKRRLPPEFIDDMRKSDEKFHKLPDKYVLDKSLDDIKPSINRVRQENDGKIPESYDEKYDDMFPTKIKMKNIWDEINKLELLEKKNKEEGKDSIVDIQMKKMNLLNEYLRLLSLKKRKWKKL